MIFFSFKSEKCTNIPLAKASNFRSSSIHYITDKTQMSGPDLHVFTLKFHSNFSPNKNWFFHFFWLKKNFSKFFLWNYYATFQCGRYSVFKKILNIFFDPKKVKQRASKVAHNRPRPFYFTVQPRPTAHGPELIFHIMKSWDQTSVLLSVIWPLPVMVRVL